MSGAVAASPGTALLSVVIPIYFNEDNIPVTWQALDRTLADLPPDVDWEVVFVDDGSGDGSYARLLELQAAAPDRVRVVKLTRNFGQVAAILAGFAHAAGDCCVVMSADLQDPPELILEMVETWRHGERRIVIATREHREDSAIARVTSRFFYRLMRRYAIPNMPSRGFDFFLVDRVVLDIINEMDERNPFLQGLVLWTGFEPAIIPYTRRRREIGRSRWTTARKIRYFIDGFVSYTHMPIRLITTIGLVVSGLSFAYALLIVVLRLVWGLPVEGFAPIMVTILGLGGVQLVMLGVIGEYLLRNSDDSRGRPSFVVEKVHRKADAQAPERPREP